MGKRENAGQRGGKKDGEGKRQRESRYLILPSLAHPRQEINREGLALSLRPSFPFSLSVPVSVSRCSFFFPPVIPLPRPVVAAHRSFEEV